MSMPKLAFSVSIDQLRATAGRVGRVDLALARRPGHVDHEVAREADTTNVAARRARRARPSSCRTLPVGVGIVRVAERGASLGVVDERTGVGADDQVVGAAGRRRRERRAAIALDLVDPVVDAAVRRAPPPLTMTRRASTSAITKPARRSRAHAGDRATRTCEQLPDVGRRPRHSPRCSRSQTQAASGDTRRGRRRRARRCPSACCTEALEVLPEDQHDVGARQRGVGHQLRAGHVALASELGLGLVGRARSGSRCGRRARACRSRPRRSRSPSARAPARCCRRRRLTPEPLSTFTRTSTGRTAGACAGAAARGRRRRGRGRGDRRLAPQQGEHRVGLGLLHERTDARRCRRRRSTAASRTAARRRRPGQRP